MTDTQAVQEDAYVNMMAFQEAVRANVKEHDAAAAEDPMVSPEFLPDAILETFDLYDLFDIIRVIKLLKTPISTERAYNDLRLEMDESGSDFVSQVKDFPLMDVDRFQRGTRALDRLLVLLKEKYE
jgi:hypothetical protein